MAPVAAEGAGWRARGRLRRSVARGDSLPRTICLAACEVSGDRNAAQLAGAIRRAAPRRPPARHRRSGDAGGRGRRARAAPPTSASWASPKGMRIVPELLRLFRRCQRLIREQRPDLVVLIDSEFVTTPFAVWLRRQRIPAAFFFPPQVWLWGRWRMPAVRPLGPALHLGVRRRGGAVPRQRGRYRLRRPPAARSGRASTKIRRPRCGPSASIRRVRSSRLMPGSRRAEIRALLPPMLGAAQLLQRAPRACSSPCRSPPRRCAPTSKHGVRASGVRDIAVYPHDPTRSSAARASSCSARAPRRSRRRCSACRR